MPDLAAASDSGASSVDNITNVTAPVFTGTAETGATVRLYGTDTTTLLGSTVAVDGTWSITASTLSAGTHTVHARATDAAGNVGAMSAGLAVTIDTAAPTMTAALVSDTGASASDGITGSAALAGMAEAYATLVFRNGTAVLGSTTANASGAWGFAPSLADGTYTLTITATDLAGNVAAPVLAGLTLDSSMPAVTAALANDTGASAKDGITRSAILAGTAEANRLVFIANGGTVLGSTFADGQGRWSYTPSLSDGNYVLTVTETNPAGKTATATVALTLDTAAPLVAITSAGGAVSQVQQVVTGTAGTANDAGNLLVSLGGNTLVGGAGLDTFVSGIGADTMQGGSGLDYVDYSASAEAVVVNMVTGVNHGGNAEGDVLSGIEVVFGSDYGDMLATDGNNHYLFGGGGGGGGGGGQDSLLGGLGNDLLLGGAGSDLFVWGSDALGGTDVISDFSRTEGDKIDLSALHLAQVAQHTGAGQFTLTYYAASQATVINAWSSGNTGAAADLSITAYAAGTGQLIGSDVRP